MEKVGKFIPAERNVEDGRTQCGACSYSILLLFASGQWGIDKLWASHQITCCSKVNKVWLHCLGSTFTCPIIPIVKWKNISKAVLTIHSHSSCIHGFMAKRDMFWSSRVNITISPGTYSFQFCASPLFMAILNICCLLHICLIHRGCLLQLACHFSWAFTIYSERTCIYALLCPSFSTSLHHRHLHSPHSLCHHPSCITKRYTIRFLVFIACTIITLYSSSFMREIPGLGTLRYVEQDGIVIDVKHFRIERCRYLS